MKCPECEKQNLKSKVYLPSGSVTTDLAWQAYYDENGNYHNHDPNAHTEVWSCSNGHEWTVTSYAPCPSCDYNKVAA